MQKVWRNEGGFSLVQTLVTIGIMAIISMAMAQVLVQMQKGQKNVNEVAKKAAFNSAVSSLYKNISICSPAIRPSGNITDSLTSLDVGFQFDSMNLTAGQNVDSYDMKVSKIEIRNLLRGDTRGNETRYVGELFIQDEAKNPQGLYVAQYKARPLGGIHLMAGAAGNIFKCSGELIPFSASLEGSATIPPDKVAENLSGAGLTPPGGGTWNPAELQSITQDCDLQCVVNAWAQSHPDPNRPANWAATYLQSSPQAQQLAQSVSTILAAAANPKGSNHASNYQGAVNNIAALDGYIQEAGYNDDTKVSVVNGTAAAINNYGVETVQNFYNEVGGASYQLAAVIVNQTGGAATPQAVNVYNTVQSYGISAQQAEAYIKEYGWDAAVSLAEKCSGGGC
ncbi:MAG: hypothetical protein HUU57_11785 [Bdellovibrio sp.]|nr:hypothetical protein [Bdellovibrio sp.]